MPFLSSTRVAIAFFLSGFAALVYQVCWQRLLFVVIGVDIESVTIVVSTFMLGLGVGAALGGAFADRFPNKVLLAFCLMEALIGAFGLISAQLLLSASDLFSGIGRASAAFLCFVLLLLPTTCMGATLPMLIANAFKSSRSVGISTGTLYFINTMGAAVGATAVGFFLLYWLEIGAVIRVAVAMNFAASVIVGSAVLGNKE